jgi:hypothetical protein
MFRVLFAPIIRSTTAAYSHRFCMVWCVYSNGAGTGFGTPLHLSTVGYRLVMEGFAAKPSLASL